MKTLKVALALAALPLAAAAQDAVKVAPQHYKVLIDNASVRVLKITYAPGAKSAMHSHADAMLVSLQDSKTRFTLPDGKTQDIEVGKETATYMTASAHAPTNVGTTPVDAILVEFKTKEPGTASLPSSRPGMQASVLAESPRAVAIKTTAAPDFREDPGTTHDYDQVVISPRSQRPVARRRGQAGRDPLAARHRAVHRPRRQARIEERERPARRVRDRRDPLRGAPEGGRCPPRPGGATPVERGRKRRPRPRRRERAAPGARRSC